MKALAKGNKLLLLLDGLDEVRQESRAKCVEAINAFRKEHGMTSLAVCSRSQDYADLNTKLSFEGAIEVQPLTQKQITEFFNRFGKEMTGIKQVLKKDSALREMAETPLFLSIMMMAYRDKREVDILVLGDEKARRKHLFDAYIERMFERRSGNVPFKKLDVAHWLSWLALKMTENLVGVFGGLRDTQPHWLNQKAQLSYKLSFRLIFGPFFGLIAGYLGKQIFGLLGGIYFGLVAWTLLIKGNRRHAATSFLNDTLLDGLILKLIGWAISMFIAIIIGGVGGLVIGLISGLSMGLSIGKSVALFFGLGFSILFSTLSMFPTIKRFTLHFILARNNLLPWSLVPFLDHCVDLIFLRRVGGGYIFVHRLLMEHFAEMYVEAPTSKGNQK